MKDAAMRSLNRKADVGIRGSAPHSRLAQESNISNIFSAGNSTNMIRMKGKGDRYEPYKGPSYQSLMQKGGVPDIKRSQLKESNNRLKALQDLDRRREEQLKKEFEALDMRRQQQEEETQRRISLKKVRLAETGYLNMKPLIGNSPGPPSLKERSERDSNHQRRFITLVKKIALMLLVE